MANGEIFPDGSRIYFVVSYGVIIETVTILLFRISASIGAEATYMHVNMENVSDVS